MTIIVNTIKGVLHPEMPDILSSPISRHFYIQTSNMCSYAAKKQNSKKNPQGGCASPPNAPKSGASDAKDTAKTNTLFLLFHLCCLILLDVKINLYQCQCQCMSIL